MLTNYSHIQELHYQSINSRNLITFPWHCMSNLLGKVFFLYGGNITILWLRLTIRVATLERRILPWNLRIYLMVIKLLWAGFILRGWNSRCKHWSSWIHDSVSIRLRMVKDMWIWCGHNISWGRHTIVIFPGGKVWSVIELIEGDLRFCSTWFPTELWPCWHTIWCIVSSWSQRQTIAEQDTSFLLSVDFEPLINYNI